MNIDDKQPRLVCLGMKPSWSKDGTQLACSCFGPVNGVWLMNVIDDGQKHIGAGWGAQFSPNGRRIAFLEGSAIKTCDLEGNASEIVFDGKNIYAQLFRNLAWSPDGQRICFKAARPDGIHEVVLVNSAGREPNRKVCYSTTSAVSAAIAWHPQGRRIVFAAHSEERKLTQLFEFDPDKDDTPTLVQGQDPKRNNTDACWTPDGKRLIIVSGDF